MRYLILLLTFATTSAFAQLERVNTLMAEAEFRSAFPEAYQSPDGFWVTALDTIGIWPGQSSWYVVGNFTRAYRFVSADVSMGRKSNGPLEREVLRHATRITDSLYLKLSNDFGKAFLWTKYYEGKERKWIPFHKSEWIKSGSHEVKLELKQHGIDLRLLSLRIEITSTEDVFEYGFKVDSLINMHFHQWGVHVPSEVLKSAHPDLKEQLDRERAHIYMLLTGPGDGWWRFDFFQDTLESFLFEGIYSANYSQFTSDSAAYNAARADVVKLRAQGVTAFGTPEVLRDSLTATYVKGTYYVYRKNYLSLAWNVWGGHVWFRFDESDGMNFRSPEFQIRIEYDRLKKKS